MGSIVLFVSTALSVVGLSLNPVPEPARAAAADVGRITGTVTGPGGVPLEGALVSAYPVVCDNGCDGYADVAGVDGSYVLDGLPPGAYHLLFQRGFDYVPEYYDNVLEEEAATEVVVTAGATVTGKNAQLEHGGHLMGTVTGRAGRALKGITVRAYRREGGKWQYRGEASTASDGSYDLTGDLLGGVYRLGFVDNREPGYVTEYYNGASYLKDAANIVLGENETLTGLNIRLAWPLPLRSVKAPKVIGTSRPGSTVRLFPGTWSPAKVSVVVEGWYAGDLQHYLGIKSKRLRLVGRALAKARGEYLLVVFNVSALGYKTVNKTLIVPGGPVAG